MSRGRSRRFRRSPAALADRLRQAAAAGAERAGMLARPVGELPRGGQLRPDLPYPAVTPEEARAVYAARPEERASLLQRAEGILRRRFDLLGYQDLDFGTPVDWHRDPVHQKRAPGPPTHWSRVPFLREDVVGDHKIVWELNRHHVLLTLAQARVLTGEGRFGDGLAQLLEEWMAANPPGQGINWASSLEVAFRAIAWTWTLHLLGEEPGIAQETVERAIRLLELQGRHVERYLSTWYSPNTHLTGEALGLLYLGVAFPGFRRAARWRARGWEILRGEVFRQVREDGTYFEQATWYQGYTVDFYVHAVALARAAGFPIPRAVTERVTAAARVLAALARPDGSLPLIGDDDGGRLLPMGPFPPVSFADSLAHAAHVLDDPALSPAAPIPAAAVWLLGAPAWHGLDRRARPRAEFSRDQAFPDGGWYVIGARDQGGDLRVVLDAGPRGALTGAHAHADALSIACDVGGRSVLADPGTFSYIGPDRDRFRATSAHGTVAVADADSAVSGGTFRWTAVPRVTVSAWEPHLDWTCVAASHDGYARIVPGLIHHRVLLRLEGMGVLVLDRLAWLPEDTRAAARWPLAPGIALAAADGATVVLARDGRPVLRLAADAPDWEPVPGWSSTCYGARAPTPILTRRPRAAAWRHGVATVLAGPGAGETGLEPGGAEGPASWRWRSGPREVLVSWGPQTIEWRMAGGGGGAGGAAGLAPRASAGAVTVVGG